MSTPAKYELDLDKFIEKLLEASDSKPGKQINLNEEDIKALCIKSREIFLSQPVFLELETPIKVLG